MEVTGNPDLTGVHFWSASQAWETRGPAPRLRGTAGSSAASGGEGAHPIPERRPRNQTFNQ